MRKIITTSLVAIALLSTTALAEKTKTDATTQTNEDTVIGTVDGINIMKSEANKFLKVITPKGQETKAFDKLEKKQQEAIVKNLAPGVLIKTKAQKEVSQEEKEQLVANYWMQKNMADIKVTDKEVKDIYDKNKKLYVKDKKQLTFDEVKEFIKMQFKQQKLVANVMKTAKVVVK
ncbi:MAG: hypothetical protein KU28_07115 [Sulfurovum sp. PC08-66]|jgi:hypothetical protein|nr:MAG: hypothetical protein KU28_07115 [Sulfurovum sp. PC08-66]